jgi:uncharacterized protein YlzI (FlbEa/FlbD family)
MIKLTAPWGRAYYVNPESIAHISEAATSSQWHGIHAVVRTVNGDLFEVREQADWIAEQTTKEKGTS